MQTIQQIKRQYYPIFQQQNLPKFWLDDWLLHILQKPAIFLLIEPDYLLTSAEFDQFLHGVARMQQGEPLAYLLGRQAFWKLDFLVNQHTLIPRPDTEVLVETVLNLQKQNLTKPLKVLDLGTGTGCIAISLAHECPNWQVVAVDFSAMALDVARQNMDYHQIKNVTLLQGSWFEPFTQIDKFDVIVSNPPYIDKNDKHLANLIYEPITALVADNQGLADILHMIDHAKNHLNHAGLLLIEHGYNQAQAVQSGFTSQGYQQVTTIKDYGGNDRITLGWWLQG